MLLHAVNSKHAWEKVFLEVRKCSILISQLSQFVDEVDILEYTDTANELDKSRARIRIVIASIPVIRLIVLGGVICLIVGLLLFGKTEQPRGVWIAFFVTLSLSLALLFIPLSSLCLGRRREKKERLNRILNTMSLD
jgi:hypothetical protein